MVKVTKASGELEDFSEQKVRESLARAGAGQHLIDEIVEHVKKELYEGIPTEHIYTHIFDILRGKHSLLVARYNLKQAVMDLGPSGYPFEKFIAGVLETYNFKTQTNLILDGECVQHEIDVMAEKGNTRAMIECKFHNHHGTKSKIRTALYTYARFLDVKEKNGFTEAWLVTNTKVTSEVLSYAHCKGMRIISWNHPADFSLRHLIEESNLHPITAIDTIPKEQKQRLLDEGTVFVRDLENHKL